MLILTNASLLWQLFRALIKGALEDLVQQFGHKMVQKVMQPTDGNVEAFLNDALHISPELVSAQLEAEGWAICNTDSDYRQNVKNMSKT